MLSLADFFQHVAYANPFLSGRVSDPSGTEVDVASIHEGPFRELVRYAEEAHRQGIGRGILLSGEPGIGKSHLLARLCRWAEQDERACYVFLHNIQASPERLPRYVLKCVISRLTEGRLRDLHGTPLYWLVTRVVKEAVRQFLPEGEIPSAVDARQAYLRLVYGWMGGNVNAGADARCVYEVLFRFFLSAWRGRFGDGDEGVAPLAVRWLSGEDLDRQEAEQLGVDAAADPDDLATLPDNQAIESVLVALAEMARGRGQPFLLCFDQVDNLTDEQVRALTQFLHPLIDHAHNLVVVTSAVQSKLLNFVERGVILQAAWERIAEDERGTRLSRIDRNQARALLEARLARFLEPFSALPEAAECRKADGLFPLGTGWLESRFGDFPEFRPRDIINWARDGWRQQQRRLEELGGQRWLEECRRKREQAAVSAPVELSEAELAAAIDAKVQQKIEEQIRRRELEPAGLPPDAGNLSGLVETLLGLAIVAEPTTEGNGSVVEYLERVPPPRRGVRPLCDLILKRRCADGREISTGLSFLVTTNATSAAFALGRILHDPDRPDQIFLITEERQSLRLGRRGEDHFRSLQDLGGERFQHLSISFRQYAELDALQAVLGEARSGDLELDLPGGRARPIREDEVLASYRRQDRYRAHPLLARLLQPPSRFPAMAPVPAAASEGEASASAPSCDDADAREFIRSELALRMGMTIHELANRYVHARVVDGQTDVEACRAMLAEVAMRMHADGVVQATPHDDQLYLLLR